MTEVKLGRGSLVTGCFSLFVGWAEMSLGLGVFNGPDHRVGLGFGFGRVNLGSGWFMNKIPQGLKL